jgi:hypothetical protein
VNEIDYGGGIWLMNFIYLYEIKQRNSAIALPGAEGGRGREMVRMI